jgi:DNA-binding response OmpR family regulator
MAEGIRVLVVEDNAAIRSSLALFLEREGFDVVAVAEFARAQDLIERELFDTLITDLDLPGGTGLDLLLKARQFRPGIRSILMTGYGCSAVRKQALELGLAAYLEKPFDPADLLSALGDGRQGSGAPIPASSGPRPSRLR